jgi:hypothetical protein
LLGGKMTKDKVHYGGIQPEKMDDADFDGVTFYISDIKQQNGDNTDIWSLNFLKAPKEVKFQEKPLGFKYTICVMNENMDVSIFDAILGDPVQYVNNCMRAREMGCVVKTSDWGSKFVEIYQNIFAKGEIENV